MRKLAAIFCLAVLLGACEKDDEFDSVKPVTAPVATKTNSGTAPSVADNMPSDHPPVGEMPSIPQPDMVRFASPDQYGKTGPLRWTAPSNWQASRPGSSMRLAEYLIPGAPEAAVLSVFYFGAGGGGGVDANVQRWVGQFDGGKATANTGEKTVNGMKVHTVDAAGEYNPGMAGGGAPPKANFRMLGAIVESDAGLFFFKLVGPKDVVAGEESNWTAFVDSFSKG